LVTARRSIRERNYDAARRSLVEMQGIRMKVLSESPDFMIEIFRSLADERHLAIDLDLYDKHVEAGVEAANAGDIDKLRFVIGQIFGNRVSTGSDAADIVELAHLLRG
jgi:molecular chaperone DnaK